MFFFSFVCCYFLLYLYFSFPQIINEFCINSIKKFIMWTWSGTYLCYCSNCICICVLHVLCCVLVFVFFLLFSCICIFQRCVECWVVVYLCYRSVCQTNPQGTLASKYCDSHFGENHNKMIRKYSPLLSLTRPVSWPQCMSSNCKPMMTIIMMINDY